MSLPSQKTKKIIEQIFKNEILRFGLEEFKDYKIKEILEIREKEKNRFYIKDLKTNADRFVPSTHFLDTLSVSLQINVF